MFAYPLRLGTAVFVGLLAGPAAAADAPAPAKPAPVTIDVGVRIGPSYRLGGAASFDVAERAGASVGGAVFVSWSRYFALGLDFEHVGLGTEQGAGDLGQITVTRSLDALWAAFRVDVLRTDAVRFAILFGPGLAWESATADGLLVAADPGVLAPFRCSATAIANLGLRAGINAEFTLGNGFSFVADATVDNLHLSSDFLDDCVPGAGTTTLIGARAGLAYRFDVTHYVR